MKNKIVNAISSNTSFFTKVRNNVHIITAACTVAAVLTIASDPTVAKAATTVSSSATSTVASAIEYVTSIPIHHISLSDTPEVTYESLESASDAVYPETFMVTGITEIKNGDSAWVLELTCANGNVFEWESEDGDWFIGDLATAIMGNNNTTKVTDDYIIDLKYAGYVGCEAWSYVADRPYVN